MNPIRLDAFEANLRFQVVSIEIFEDLTRLLKSKADFRNLRFVSQKT
jgi:hypothetical protein